jgi:hypothetical protein
MGFEKVDALLEEAARASGLEGESIWLDGERISREGLRVVQKEEMRI